MLSGFFDDAQDEDSNKTKKKENIRKSNSSLAKTNHIHHPSKVIDQKYKSNDNSYSRSQKSKPKYQDDYKTNLKKRTIPKKYPSPPRPPLPPLKPIKAVKKYPQNKSNEVNEQPSNKTDSLQFTEVNIMDKLLTYQKRLIDKVSNFRAESIKQIDLMIGEIDKVDYSKYS